MRFLQGPGFLTHVDSATFPTNFAHAVQILGEGVGIWKQVWATASQSALRSRSRGVPTQLLSCFFQM